MKAIYNCVADNPDELTFSEGEVIVVDGEEDQEWWVSIPDVVDSLFCARVRLWILATCCQIKAQSASQSNSCPAPVPWMSALSVTMAAKAESHDLTLADIPSPPLVPSAAASSVEPLV